MATNIPIPKLGQSEETVTIENWHVKEGDTVKKGDILFDVETDKAVLEVESQFEGTLLKIIIPAGKEVPVMSIAAVIGKKGEAIPEIEQPKAVEAPKPVSKKAVTTRKTEAGKVEQPENQETVQSANIAVQVAAPVATPVKPSPRARAFAKDFLIDLDKVSGTGGSVGRVTEADVKNYLETSGYNDKKITPAAFNVAKKENIALLDVDGEGESGRITLADIRDAVSEKPRVYSAMRKIISQRLTQSKQQIPHFYVTVSIDMTDLLKRRKEMKDEGISISVNVFILKAIAAALKEFPMVNATTDGASVKYKSKINIGVAVSLEGGLVVPVIKNADKKALDEIHAEIAELADKARNNKLLPEEMQGGTFTISNMGMLGVENFAAIINPGETGILAVSATIPTPVVRDGEIVIRDMMKITLSADHRAVDGADGANFANAVKNNLESAEIANL
jgi:pyruvate dehydrogenase E2 component (dihydrolipoyllysine-residue acetyltransferase)